MAEVKTTIAPTLLVDTPEAFKTAVEKVQPFAKRVHIDLTDGEFAPTATIEPGQVWWPETWTVDIHAMVKSPSLYVQSLIDLKPNTIIFHAEVDEDLRPILQMVKKAGIQAGVALLKQTVPETVEDYIKEADYVLIFSGNLGYYGGTADMMQLEKIRLVKKINETAEIGWDGGANIDNIYSLTHGMVNVINVGGALSNADNPQEVYNKMVEETTKQGVI